MPVTDQGLDSAQRYQFIPRVLIFLTRGEQILLLKGAADKRVWPNLYNGLGGHVERGESVLAAAQREIREESGLEAKKLWLCAVVTIDIKDERGILMFVFRGEAPLGDLLHSNEGSPEWIPRSQLHQLNLVEDLPALLPKILDLQPHQAPIWGHYSYDHAGKLKIDFD